MDRRSAADVAREHVEEIRRVKFSIGGEPNPLKEDLHLAVSRLSADLYTKDIHFLTELIQNAEDNEYWPGVKPRLEFVITTEDITRTSAPATLIVYNNEKGFSKKNIESMCSVGQSTKKGKRDFGFIGEKGIGFKSVFLVTTCPYIFSNGYKIRFSEEPDLHCGIGYIVPEWVDGMPTVHDLHKVYGLNRILPTTTIVLPLRAEKVNAVKHQLSTLHPELLLFLSKIRKVSIQENNKEPSAADIGTAIFVSYEIDLKTRADINADSHQVILSAQEGEDKKVQECRYYMWRQRFPVKAEHRVNERHDVKEWVVSLAFPLGERLKRGDSSSGIYAFLPTEMHTNFPFVIQSDFILSSSRETILLNNKWNLGILDCVGHAFSEAFVDAVKSGDQTVWGSSSMAKVFEFLPTNAASYLELNRVRESIKKNLETKNIILCETFTTKKVFCKPTEARRIISAFRDILSRLKDQGVALESIFSLGKYICHSSLDLKCFHDALSFVGVRYLDYNWYAKCIQHYDLVLQASEDVYVELLLFLMNHWCSLSYHIGNIATLKYLDQNGKTAVCSINSATAVCNINSAAQGTHMIRLGLTDEHHTWMNKWNVVFKCPEMYFLPNETWLAIRRSKNCESLKEMLKTNAGVKYITLSEYVVSVVNFIRRTKNRRLVIDFTHFLCHSLSEHFISSSEIYRSCPTIPVVDRSGCVNLSRTVVLVPASVSKWAMLVSSNPWTRENYVELGNDYANCFKLSAENSMKMLHDFMVEYVKPKDIPQLCPPTGDFSIPASKLTKDQALLLLDWISHLRTGNFLMLEKFYKGIRERKWLKTCAGYNSPNQCLLSDEEESFIFTEMGHFLSQIPVIDEQFYDGKIRSYENDLKFLGVKFGVVEAYPMIVKHLMSLTECQCLSREAAIPLLKLVKYSMKREILTDENLKVLKEELSLNTICGYKVAFESILWDSKWDCFSEIADLPFIDDSYYGKDIYSFKDVLAMMGVVVDFRKGSNLLIAGLKLPKKPASAASKYALSLLEQIRFLNGKENQKSFAADLIKEASNRPWLKTNIGFMRPTESFLSDPEWACVLHVLEVPLIDETFYKSKIESFKMELQLLGVIVNFDDAKRIICSRLKELSSSSKLSKRHILSLLNCLKNIKGMKSSTVNDFISCLSEEKCLQTCHGYKRPADSILFNSEWGPISDIAVLPFIDDSFYGKSIYLYRDELKIIGVVVDLRDGCRFVVEGLKLPKEPVEIMAASALSLLECIRILLEGASDNALPDDFLRCLKSEWIVTQMGYRTPDQCLLFNSKASSSTNDECGGALEPGDAPFIDENYYGTGISLYRRELKAMGVIVEDSEGCTLLAEILKCHTDFFVIKRIYGYLSKFKWKLQSPSNSKDWIWIPDQNGGSGDWVHPGVCVLSDVDNLFGGRLHVLDKYYEKSLLFFFSTAFGVAKSPSIHDYLKLWYDWELKSRHQITAHECWSFWKYICSCWHIFGTKNIENFQRTTKLPARSKSPDSTVQLIDIEDLLIPDDFQLEQIFTEASTGPLFVWRPQPSTSAIPISTLYMIYGSLGVRKLSESAQIGDEFCMDHRLLKAVPRNVLIGEGLLKLVLAFLADLSYSLGFRHEAAKLLLNLSVFETLGPVVVSYKLVLPPKKQHVSVKAPKMVFWAKTNNKLIIQTPNKSDHKINVEFACQFARVISEGLLLNAPYRIDGLYKLIRLGCFLDFNLDSIDCLLKMEKLEVLADDELFISSEFAADITQPKRKAESTQVMSPLPCPKRQRCDG